MSDPAGGLDGSVLRGDRGRTFELIRLLGRGGFGEVYLARMHQGHGIERYVALKLLNPELDPNSRPVERMRAEARLLASLQHPVILAAHELVELEGRMAMVTEYVEGQDLSACFKGDQAMPRGASLEVVEQVAGALHAAWSERQVIHRDIKPANIRIGAHGNVKLLDFGIARSELAARTANTNLGTLVGTLQYMSPERYDVDAAPDRASDIFALGCVWFEAWTGHRFYERLQAPQLFKLSQDEGAYQIYLSQRFADSDIGPHADLLNAMLSFDAGARPGAFDVARRCEAIASDWPGRITLRRWCRDRDWEDISDPATAQRVTGGPPDRTLASSTLPQSALSSTLPSFDAEQDIERERTTPAPLRIRRHRPSASTVLQEPTRRSVGAWFVVVLGLLLGGGGLVGLGAIVVAVVAGTGWLTPSGDGVAVGVRSTSADPVLIMPGEAPDGSDLPPIRPAVAPVAAPVVAPAAVRPGPGRAPPPLELAPAPTASPAPVALTPRSVRDPAVAPPEPAVASPEPAVASPEPAVAPPEPAPVAPRLHWVFIRSEPIGAVVRVDGRSVGTTPVSLELTGGAHTVSLSLGSDELERSIRVGRNKPDQYVWEISEARWASGYAQGASQ